ncbi:MAG: O-acetyl-ADP-ribose deacetylase [Candidatus Aminicenantes bacterium]|nr:O-acetyl-ADP-ribose deacetylase [Candidatus Aminicenantes bacterium]
MGMRVKTLGNKTLKLIQGNIALVDAEAIVNAANKSLILGGGVAGAIRSFGGPSIQEECNSIGPIEVGEAVITGAGKLKATYVIHAAGPVYGEGQESDKLKRATSNSLELAEKKKIKTIAFPAISTGIFRFPIKRCSEIMIKTCLEFLGSHSYPKEIILCLYGEKAFSVFEKTLENMEQPSG